MGSTIPPTAKRSPGLGLGWLRTAAAVAEQVTPEEVTGIWLFPPVRREDREWGTAVVARYAGGGRRRIYTATYMLIVRGRDKGQGRVAVEEVGEGPESVVPDVITGVQERAGEAEPPVEVAAELWFPPNSSEAMVTDDGRRNVPESNQAGVKLLPGSRAETQS